MVWKHHAVSLSDEHGNGGDLYGGRNHYHNYAKHHYVTVLTASHFFGDKVSTNFVIV